MPKQGALEGKRAARKALRTPRCGLPNAVALVDVHVRLYTDHCGGEGSSERDSGAGWVSGALLAAAARAMISAESPVYYYSTLSLNVKQYNHNERKVRDVRNQSLNL